MGLGLALLPRTASRLSHNGVVFKNVTDRYLQFETAIFARKDIVRGSLKEVFRLVVSRLQDRKDQGRMKSPSGTGGLPDSIHEAW